MLPPETRASLLGRISDPQDADAWQQFETLYRPVVFNLARRRGMQSADADDLTQAVLMSVAGAIKNFDASDGRAKFRTWLQRIARNAIINAMTRPSPDAATGGTEMMQRLHRHPTPGPETETIATDYRREIFVQAAREIQPQFATATWDAFWQTVVEGRSIADVAEQQSRTAGSVYTPPAVGC